MSHLITLSFSKKIRNKLVCGVKRVSLFVGTLLILSLFIPSEFALAQSTLSGESASFKVQGVIAVPIQTEETINIPLKSTAPSVSVSKPMQRPSAPVASVRKKAIQPKQQPVVVSPVKEDVKTVTDIAYCEGSWSIPVQTMKMGADIEQTLPSRNEIPTSVNENHILVYGMIIGSIVLLLTFVYLFTLERKLARLESLLLVKVKRLQR